MGNLVKIIFLAIIVVNYKINKIKSVKKLKKTLKNIINIKSFLIKNNAALLTLNFKNNINNFILKNIINVKNNLIKNSVI